MAKEINAASIRRYNVIAGVFHLAQMLVVVNSFLLSTDGVDTNAFDKFTNSILEVLDSEEGFGEDLSFILVFIFSLF